MCYEAWVRNDRRSYYWMGTKRLGYETTDKSDIQFFDDYNSGRLKKNSAQDVYAYDHALKFSILQENPSLKQTETPNC